MEAKELKSGVRQANAALDNFEATTSKVFNRFGEIANANIEKVNSQLSELKNIEVGQQLEDFASRGTATVRSFLTAASQVEQFRLTLTTLTGSAAEAEQELSKLQQFAGATPFELKNVVEAGVQLKTLGADVDRFLPLAGDLASVFNRDISDSARALGKALSGSQDGIQVLNDSFGITKRELKEAGAVMKSSGAIALDSQADLRALADAIEKVAQQKNFAGAINDQLQSLQGNTSQLSDAAFKLAASIGESLIPVFIPLVQVATNAVNAIANLPKPLLAVVGGVTALATAAAAGGAGLIALRTVLSGVSGFAGQLIPVLTGTASATAAAGTAATGAAAGFAALLGPISLIGAGVGLSLLAINEYEQDMKKLDGTLTKQASSFTATTNSFRTYRDAISSATGESRDFINIGQDTRQIVDAIRKSFQDLDGIDLTRSLGKAGVTLQSVNEDLKQSQKRQEDFRNGLRDLSQALTFLEARDENARNLTGSDAGFSDEQVKQYRATLVKEFGTIGVTVDTVKQRIEQYQNVFSNNSKTIGAQRAIQGELSKTDKALQSVVRGSQSQLAELKIKAQTDDLDRSNALLKETEGRIIGLKGILSGQGIDVSSVQSIQDQLSLSGNENEKAALQGILDLIKEKNKLEKQSADIVGRTSKARVDAVLEAAKEKETVRERLSILREALATEQLTAETKKQLIGEIRREEKALAQEQKQAYNERVQQAIFEAQQVEGGAQVKLSALRRVLQQYELEGAVRRRVLNEISKAEKDLAKERQQRSDEEQDALFNETIRQQELIIAAIDERISKLREEAAAGKNVNSQLVAALEERTQKEIDLIRARNAERAGEAKSEKVKAEIEKTGILEVDAARRKGTDAIDEQKKAQTERIKKLREERAEALKTVKDEDAARRNAARTLPAPSSGFGPSQNPFGENAPGQSFQQVAADLASSFSKEAGRARADEIRAGRDAKAASDRQRFRDANPELAAKFDEFDAAIRDRIAQQDTDRAAEVARRNTERVDAALARQKSVAAEILTAQRGDAARRTELAGLQGPNLGGIVGAQQGFKSELTVKVELTGDQAKNAKVTRAGVDGRGTEVQRTMNSYSFKVGT